MPASAPTIEIGLEIRPSALCSRCTRSSSGTNTIVEEHGKVFTSKKEASDSSAARALDVATLISNEETTVLVDRHVRECPKDHAGIGLAVDMIGAKSFYSRIWMIRTKIEGVDECALGRQLFLHPVV